MNKYTVSFTDLPIETVEVLHQALLAQPMGRVEGLVFALRAQVQAAQQQVAQEVQNASS